jgi:hypothetical protein
VQRTWTLQSPSGPSDITASFSAWTGKVTVQADGRRLVDQSVLMDAMTRQGVDIPVGIAGHDVVLQVRTGGLRNGLELVVDGAPYEPRTVYKPLPASGPRGGRAQLADVIDWAMAPVMMGSAIPMIRSVGLLGWGLMLPGCVIVHYFARIERLPAWLKVVGSLTIFVGWFAPAILIGQAIRNA